MHILAILYPWQKPFLTCGRNVVGEGRAASVHREIGAEAVDEMCTKWRRTNGRQQQVRRRRRPVEMRNWPDGSGEGQECEDFAAWEDEPLGLDEEAKGKRRQ